MNDPGWDAPNDKPSPLLPRGRALTSAEVLATLHDRWGPSHPHRQSRYWVSDDGCLVACIARGTTPVLRVHSGFRKLVHFIEVGAERDLDLALTLLADFRPGAHALGRPPALSLDLWDCPGRSNWAAARAVRATSSELRAWSRALRATSAIASRVSAALTEMTSPRPLQNPKLPCEDGRKAG